MMEFTWSASEMAPTATVGIPISLRILSENGVWNIRPYAGALSGVVCPLETSIRSHPACAKARAICTASSPVSPPSTQSVAEMRTDIGFSAGHTSRIAANTSSGKRKRFSRLPPYSSVRRLVSGERKEASR